MGQPNAARGHGEGHRVERIGWLRAAVLGANDGIISTASLIVGVAATDADRTAVLTAGVAGLVAGAMSMAAGEFVSVSSQADAERADRARERYEIETMPEAELEELTLIYQARGLEPGLARQVAEALTAKDAYGAHLRDELGLTAVSEVRPVQTAVTSALTFSAGAAVPVLFSALVAPQQVGAAVGVATLVALQGWEHWAPIRAGRSLDPPR